ncbi:hypothetical protein ID866_2493 [Astraeus odoratus]|nr:hypothetical protein ID866_2493 [Astraeus odoratus]
MGKSVYKPFPRDFFTPHPCQWKGKQKAQEPVIFDCTECSDSPTVIVIFCLPFVVSLTILEERNRLFMTSEVIPRRLRATRPGGPPRSLRRHSSSSVARPYPLPVHDHGTTPTLFRTYQDTPGTHLHSQVDIRYLLDPSAPFDPNTAWAHYSEFVTSNSRVPFTPGEHLLFMERLMAAVEPRLGERTGTAVLHKWGHRLHSVLQKLEVGSSELAPEDFRKLCFSARISAMMGDILHAVHLVKEAQRHQSMEAGRAYLIDGYRSIILLVHLREGCTAVLDFIIREWNFLGPYVSSHRDLVVGPLLQGQLESLRATVHKIIAEVPNGAALLSSGRNRNEEDLMHTAGLLFQSYLTEGLLEGAHAVMLQMCTRGLPLPLRHQLALVRALAKANLFSLANEVFSFIPPSNYKPYLSAGLYLHARQGNITRAEVFFGDLRSWNCLTSIDKAMLMHAYAVSGHVETVVELFRDFFPGENREEEPTIVHYTTVVFAYAQRRDFDGLNHWLKTMMEDGHTPDAHVYSIILESFASQGEVDMVATVLDQMRAANLQPSHIHYTTVIKFLAERRDPASAEAIYKRALHEGITPDRIMITALMNAHVEAGSWAGVIRVFDYLKTSGHHSLRLTIEVYNTLLKAYVLIGTPFHTVSTLFRKLQKIGVRPDAYSYALIIQSACDAGLMNIASDLFVEMKDRIKRWEPHRGIDVYVLTIILAGHLRLGQKLQAKTIYEDMIACGVQPTPITFSQILQAYGNQGTEESLRIAETFLQGIVQGDSQRRSWTIPGSLQAALEKLHSPLMSVYSKQRNPEAVERLFQAMLDAGGKPSLVSLTILLDVYRRTDNIKAVNEVWEQIWKLALHISSVDKLFKEDSASTSPSSRQSNMLCLPLSIYIDALSATGHHSAVPEVWLKARSHGFSFDSHNWNHLAVALVRAAELDRAFAVVERVILPYQRQSQVIACVRDPSPDSPLTFDMTLPNVDNPASESRLHSPKRRADAVKLATKKSKHNLDGDSDDFAHPLHVLHQVLPSWNMWRPHHVILEVLASVLRHLQGGRVVQPVGVTLQLPSDPEHIASRSRTASDTLRRIYNDYPSTVRAVLLHERAISRQNAISKVDDGWR